MGRYNVPLDEQETIIQFNRTDKSATIYTSDSTIMTKLDKLCEKSPNNYMLTKTDTVEGNVVGKFYKLADKKLLTFRKEKRVLTEEQKEQLRLRALSGVFSAHNAQDVDADFSDDEDG